MEQKKSKGKTTPWAGELVQAIGLVVLGAGCILELIHKAGIWLVVITIGSVVFAIGTKLKGR